MSMSSLDDKDMVRIYSAEEDNGAQNPTDSNEMTSVAVIWNRDNKETHPNCLNAHFKEDSN